VLTEDSTFTFLTVSCL